MRASVVGGSIALSLVGSGLVGSQVAHAAVQTCAGHRATIVGDSRSNIIHGTPHDDVIVGLAGSDSIFAGKGDDIICGGAGHDHLNGGPGIDRLYGGMDGLVVTDEERDRIGDELRGGAGDDLLRPGYDSRPADEVFPDSYLFDDATRAVQVDLLGGTATGEGHDRLIGHDVAVLGSDYGDLIRGTDGADHLDGGPGSDIVRALGGDDRLVGDSGRHAENENDRLYGGPGDDEISAVGGADVFHGGAGNDSMDDTGRSADRMYGDAGDDLIIDEIWNVGDQHESGGPGRDHLSLLSSEINPQPVDAIASWDMRTGAMAYTLGASFQDPAFQSSADGFEDADLATWGTAWTIDGTGGPNYLSAGGSRGTVFRGHGGHDHFVGSPSPDTFDGGPGTDTAVSLGVDPYDTCTSVEDDVYDECDMVVPPSGQPGSGSFGQLSGFILLGCTRGGSPGIFG